MERFIAKKTCYWGPQPGTESLIQKGEEVMAHGNEPNIAEFFEAVDVEPVIAPKKGGKKATPVEEDL